MTVFWIKIIACVSMFLDHVKYLIGESNFATQFLGRLAFPLFMFVMVEGYCHTRDVKKYLIRLGVGALISQIPYQLFVNNLVGVEGIKINVIATFLVTMVCLMVWDKSFSKFYSAILIVVIGLLAQNLNFEYGFYGIIIGMIFYIFREKKLIRAIIFCITTVAYYFIKFQRFSSNCIIYMICTVSVLIPMGLYNGKKGNGLKYLFYAFYPVHMLIFYIIANCIK